MKFIHLFTKSLIVVATMVGLITQPLQAADGKTIVVYGASGRIGGVIVEVALERGYRVIGVSRKPENLQFDHRNFTGRKGDLMDVKSVRELAKGADAIVISVISVAKDNRPENSLVAHAATSMVEALSDMERVPYIVEIGSASLMYGETWEEISGNMTHVPFPLEVDSTMYGVIMGHQIALQIYELSKLPWTIVAPPITINGITRGGISDSATTKETYRTSTTEPVIDADGGNSVYVRDLARSAVDEIENKKFVRQVFTVGY